MGLDLPNRRRRRIRRNQIKSVGYELGDQPFGILMHAIQRRLSPPRDTRCVVGARPSASRQAAHSRGLPGEPLDEPGLRRSITW